MTTTKNKRPSVHERLVKAYDDLNQADGRVPSVRELREASGVGQSAVVAFLRKRREVETATTVPAAPKGFAEALAAAVWPQSWAAGVAHATEAVRQQMDSLEMQTDEAELTAVYAQAQADEDRQRADEAAQEVKRMRALVSDADARVAAAEERAALADERALAAEKRALAAEARVEATQELVSALREDMKSARARK